VLDLARAVVQRSSEGQGAPPVDLTPLEARLLRYLARAAPRPVPNDELLEAVWGYAPSARSRAVRVTVGRLRNKLEVDPARPTHLVTVRGAGYRLAAEPVRDAELHPPASLDAFVGRSRDRAAVLEAVRGRSWVTLEGPPGVGKTRLALEVAHAWAGPVGWFALGQVGSAEGALGRIASRMGLRLADPLNLGRALADRVSLVVLDELERIAPELAGFVDPWLEHTSIRVLATSRVPLGVRGEKRFEVGPLDGVASVELLSARSGLPVNALEGVASRCDGLPLAIELAATAARGGVLVPDAASEDDGILAGAMRRSWELLDDGPREVLATAAAFGGPFQLERIRDVLPPERTARAAAYLHLLRTHGLLVREGDARLRLLTSLQDALTPLAPDAIGRAADRHRAVFVEVASDAAEALFTPARRAVLDALIAERAELEVAIDRAVQSAPAQAAVLVRPWVYALRVRTGETGQARLQAVDDACRARGVATEAALQVRCMVLESAIGATYDAAQDELAAMRQAALDSGQAAIAARIAARLGRSLVLLGDYPAAAALFEEAIAQEAPPRFAARIHVGLAKVAQVEGDGDRAERHLHAALAVLGDVVDPPVEGEIRMSLGRLALDRGAIAEARRAFTEAMEVGRADGEYATLRPLGALANADLVAGQHEAALKGFDALSQLAARLGESRQLAIAQIRRTGILVERGDDEADHALAEIRSLAGSFDSAEIAAAVEGYRFLHAMDRDAPDEADAALQAMAALDLPPARALERRYWHALRDWMAGAPIDSALIDAFGSAGQAGFRWGLLALSALDGDVAAERALRQGLPPTGGAVYRALLDWARTRRISGRTPDGLADVAHTGVLLRLAMRRENLRR
jgi:DNA-binding winged helix-turn-helix (wHTH) protein/tetratricopeptide (TPR) repeat protein